MWKEENCTQKNYKKSKSRSSKKKVENKVDPSRIDPDVSNVKSAKIQSFLWKPESDVTHNPVILVTCDALRSEDLKCEILNVKNRPIKIKIENSARANKLDQYKYGRIHFRIGRSAEKLLKLAKLTVVLYHTIGGKKVILKKIKIKDPTKRVER